VTCHLDGSSTEVPQPLVASATHRHTAPTTITRDNLRETDIAEGGGALTAAPKIETRGSAHKPGGLEDVIE